MVSPRKLVTAHYCVEIISRLPTLAFFHYACRSHSYGVGRGRNHGDPSISGHVRSDVSRQDRAVAPVEPLPTRRGEHQPAATLRAGA